jgi:putative glutathione S-transferase
VGQEDAHDREYDNISNGVDRCGIARSQAACERNFQRLFAALDQVEADLGRRPFLAGDEPTEAEWRLFTTLARFDATRTSTRRASCRQGRG